VPRPILVCALLELSQPRLAEAARLGLSPAVDFERGRLVVSDDPTRAMLAALGGAHVIFLEETGKEPSVRLRERQNARLTRFRLSPHFALQV
jgi:hypothetical protein